MENNQPIVHTEGKLQLNSLQDVQTLGKLFVESGMFTDTKSVAQAVVKILAGQEMGIGPFQAMDGIDIIGGRISISPLLLASILKSQNKYNYRVIESTETKCLLAFYENGKHIGFSDFTLEEAKKMGLSNKENWIKQPKTMLFWRCLSRGIRMFAPDLYRGLRVYIPEELDPNANITDDTQPIQEPEKPEVNYSQEEPPIAEPKNPMSKLQLKKLFTLAQQKGIPEETFAKWLQNKYKDFVPEQEYNNILEYLKQLDEKQFALEDSK
ncbi:hypothetical protein [Caldisericum sp.]|uniref:hypothetical protein n=1 Tax=Caldisericum sp. TaxID=2499687 RepID=UPI003D0CCA31